MDNVIFLTAARKSLIRKRKRWEAIGDESAVIQSEGALIELENKAAAAADAEWEFHIAMARAHVHLNNLRELQERLRSLRTETKRHD